MAKLKERLNASGRRIRYRDRAFQVPIYLGKLLRGFAYQRDWKVLPMTAIIAALVSMVIRRKFFVTMEGGLMGAFALTCVAIWNGCFNSIQSICRERGIVKREHRSGMHISAYVFSHMVYQAMLCVAQSALSIYVCKICGVQFPAKGLITPYLTVDIGITMFLASYASDMISLFVSGITHSTTAAMTVMPFLLIFQLIFSGGMLTLPVWAKPLSNFTISNYTLKALAAQSDYNHMPSETGWKTLESLLDEEEMISFTVGQLLDLAGDQDNPAIAQLRDKRIGGAATVGELRQLVEGMPAFQELQAQAPEGKLLLSLLDGMEDQPVAVDITVGEVLDQFTGNPAVQAQRDQEIEYKVKIKDLLDLAGEEKVKEIVQEKTSKVAHNPDYEMTKENIYSNWLCICAFSAVFAMLTVVALEFIDKDKR